MSYDKPHIATQLIHAGEEPDPITGAIAPVLVRSKTYKQPGFGNSGDWQYSRCKNPTRSILETKLEQVCGGGKATVFSSGDAATAMLLLTLKPGDHIILCRETYGGTTRLFEQLFAEFGICYDFVDITNKAAALRAITPRTKYFFVETPSNPSLGILDLDYVRQLSEETGIPYIADLTFSPPVALQPFAYGAETIIYSLSKYFGGHNDAIGGAVITKNPELHQRLCFLQWTVGAILSPDECYRIIQGMKTLDLRWAKASASALTLAEYLQNHPAIEGVLYPGLPEHPGHHTAKKQMRGGFGSVVSFEVKVSDRDKLSEFVDRAQATNLIMYAESLASPETILAHPASMSHRALTPQNRAELGLTDGFFRLSLGLENADDIMAALDQALECLVPAPAKKSVLIRA